MVRPIPLPYIKIKKWRALLALSHYGGMYKSKFSICFSQFSEVESQHSLPYPFWIHGDLVIFSIHLDISIHLVGFMYIYKVREMEWDVIYHQTVCETRLPYKVMMWLYDSRLIENLPCKGYKLLLNFDLQAFGLLSQL